MEVYAGDPDLYVNPGSVPLNPLDSSFNSKDHFNNEELILETVDRERLGAIGGTYYIGVFGKTASTFKITVKNEKHSIFLKPSLSESGYLDENQVKLYYFREPVLAEEGVDVEFSLHVMTGRARLRGNLCAVSEFDNEKKMI